MSPWIEGQRHYLSPEVARGLRAARLRLGLSFRRAEAKTGVTAGHLCQIEHSNRCPSMVVADAIVVGYQLEFELAQRLRQEARPDAGRSWHGGVSGTEVADEPVDGAPGAALDRQTRDVADAARAAISC